MSETRVPTILAGDIAVDDRGSLSFVNAFAFDDVKRFYVVANHRAGFVRAWHGHRREAKYMTCVTGCAVAAAVPIDNWQAPACNVTPDRFVLSAARPSILYVPPGYANGFMSLTADTRMLIFSTATLEESREDDVRWDARYWDCWEVIER
jgi:dTDP-4-dehydrorhamnose 3,5-epimerase-like enzyme